MQNLIYIILAYVIVVVFISGLRLAHDFFRDTEKKEVHPTLRMISTANAPSSALTSSGKAPSSGQNFGCGLLFTNTDFGFGHIFGRNLEFLA